MANTHSRTTDARFFFVALGLFAIVAMLVVFVPRYLAYFSGQLQIAWLPNVHGLLMTLWLLTFTAQAVLASTGRIALHRKVGSFAIPLGVAAWISMVLIEFWEILVHPPANARDLDWLLPGVYCYTTFPLFFAAAIRLRRRPDWHKRLMVIAAFVALMAVEERMDWLPHAATGFWSDFAYVDAWLVIPLAVFDWTTLKRIHPATLIGGGVLLAAQLAVLLAWGSPAWHRVSSDAVRLITAVA